MPAIPAFVDAAGIVEQAEQQDHVEVGSRLGRQTPPILEYASPMGNAMQPSPREGVLSANDLEQMGNGNHGNP
jgi:hypothetical protein